MAARVPAAMLREAVRGRMEGRPVVLHAADVAVGDTVEYTALQRGQRMAIVTKVYPRKGQVRVVCRVRVNGVRYVLWRDVVHEAQLIRNLGQVRYHDLAKGGR